MLNLTTGISWFWISPIIFVWLILIIFGSFRLSADFFLNAIHSNHLTSQNIVALTFDDGPHQKYTLQVLALLKTYEMKASFFCIGKNIEKNPDILKEILKEGHLIGNHSFEHHPMYGFFSTKRVTNDLSRNHDLIFQITNKKLKLFRPPFGVTNPNIARAVKKLNLTTIGWTVRPFDTVVKDPIKIYQRITSRLKKGDIILLHDTNKTSVMALESILKYLKENNFKSVTVDELIKIKSYE